MCLSPITWPAEALGGKKQTRLFHFKTSCWKESSRYSEWNQKKPRGLENREMWPLSHTNFHRWQIERKAMKDWQPLTEPPVLLSGSHNLVLPLSPPIHHFPIRHSFDIAVSKPPQHFTSSPLSLPAFNESSPSHADSSLFTDKSYLFADMCWNENSFLCLHFMLKM